MKQKSLIKRTSLFIAALFSLALLFAGCGGDDDGSAADGNEVTVETGSLTKAQFIKEADAICQKSEESMEKLVGDYVKAVTENPSQASPSAQAATLVNTVMAPAYEKLIDRLGALGAPSDDEEEITAFLTSLQESLDKGREQPLKFVRSREPFVEGVELSKVYGFNVCLA